MTPATEALVVRLEDRAQNGFEHPVVDALLIEAAAALRAQGKEMKRMQAQIDLWVPKIA